jgi:septal ring factor EnvC (AmiA/AmiB activator)
VKDKTIDNLQAENNELRQGEATIEELEETLHSAQYALDKSTGDRFKLENNFKIQVDNDAIVINSLKNEGIDLKHSLADRNEEIARLRSTMSNLKYTVDLKRGDAHHLGEDNDHLKDVAARLDRDLKIESETNNELRSEFEIIDASNKHLDFDIKNSRNRIRTLEAENDESRGHQDSLNRDIDDLEPRIREVTAQISLLDSRCRAFGEDLADIEGWVGDLAGKYDAERDMYERIHADLMKENDRSLALQEDHKRLVDAIECARGDLDGLRREADDLNEKVRLVTSSNADLEYQLAELKRHIDVLSKQNQDLNIELEEILDWDRRVREEIERRSTIVEKQRKNDEDLKRSMSDVTRTMAIKFVTKSPTRDSPTRG